MPRPVKFRRTGTPRPVGIPAIRESTQIATAAIEKASHNIRALIDQDALPSGIEYGAVPRGAFEGPLATLRPVFIDFETLMGPQLSLDKMTLRQYLAGTRIDSLALAIGDNPVQLFVGDGFGAIPAGGLRLTPDIVGALSSLAADPEYVFVAHNAAFDIRVMTILLGVPWPRNVWCTLEGSMGAWPEWPGGYSLHHLARSQGLPRRLWKIALDLPQLQATRRLCPTTCDKLDPGFLDQLVTIAKDAGLSWTPKEPVTEDFLLQAYGVYNCRDVETSRELYWRQIACLPAVEQRVALRTHRQRRFHLEVSEEALESLITAMDHNIEYQEKKAEELASEDGSILLSPADVENIFNRGGEKGSLKSVRSARLLKIINRIGDDQFTTTSLKRVNQALLARNRKVADILATTSAANKSLFHRRRAAVFNGVGIVDVELGPFRAHTYRFSAPSPGKGLNFHNTPKRDITVAKPVRETFRLPSDLCFVRGDLANVEFRVEGWLCDSLAVFEMFDPRRGGAINNDPYCVSWRLMTGLSITKADNKDIRQLAKTAVLGLGYSMSPTGYAKQLLLALADPTSGVTEAVMQKVVDENKWELPPGRMVKKIVGDLGCSILIATAAYHIHRVFNQTYPEYRRVADWLVEAVQEVATCAPGPEGRDQARAILDCMYLRTDAPDRNKINLEIDDDPRPRYASVRVCCGPWTRSVCWREPHNRPTKYSGNAATDIRLTVRKAHGIPKPFSPCLAIENVCQAAARNGLCMGVEELERRGFPDCLHIHDEGLLIVPRRRDVVLKAREAIIDVFNGKNLPLGWALFVNPDEVCISQSLYEDEKQSQATWAKLRDGDDSVLEHLT